MSEIDKTISLNKKEKEQTVEQLENLVSATDFWTYQKLGLALFVEPANTRYIRLPHETNAFYSVGDQFIVSPLELMQTVNCQLYVLDINLNNPKLYQADASSLELIEDTNLPDNIESALRLDEFQKNQQFHTGAAGSRAMYHGHGAADDNKDVDIENYLHLLAKRIDTFLQRREPHPLLLVGVKERISYIRKQLTYKHVLEEEVVGNFDASENRLDLSVAVHKIIDNLIRKKHTEHEHSYKAAAGNGLATAGAKDITEAAKFGNIDTLYVHVVRYTKDSVRSGRSEIIKFEFPETKNIAKLEEVVSLVKAQGGRIIAQDKAAHQHTDSLSAILRRRPS